MKVEVTAQMAEIIGQLLRQASFPGEISEVVTEMKKKFAASAAAPETKVIQKS